MSDPLDSTKVPFSRSVHARLEAQTGQKLYTEADLKAAREEAAAGMRVESGKLVPHKTYTKWKDGIDVDVCTVDCPRCAIENLPLEAAERGRAAIEAPLKKELELAKDDSAELRRCWDVDIEFIRKLKAENDALRAALDNAANFVEKSTPYLQGVGTVGKPMADHIRELKEAALKGQP